MYPATPSEATVHRGVRFSLGTKDYCQPDERVVTGRS